MLTIFKHFHNPQTVKENYKALAKQYHPDLSKIDTNGIMAEINSEYPIAVEAADKGGLFVSSKKVCHGRSWFNYNWSSKFSLGTYFVGDTSIIFVLDNPVWKDKFKQVTYPTRTLETDFARYFPGKPKFERDNILMFEKTSDVYALKQLLAVGIEPEHSAWVISRLCNLLCFLEHSNLVHCGLDKDAIFLSPEHHSALIMGGWFYAGKQGETLTSVPNDVYKLMTPPMKSVKVKDSKLDRRCVKRLCAELFKGTGKNTILAWANGPDFDNAIEMYTAWDAALDKDFGVRKFIKWEKEII